MTQAQWTAVDKLITNRIVGNDDVLDAALRANAVSRLPAIDVSPPLGQLLHLLAKATKARNILEIGTLGGYSTICLTRALPDDGRLITLEYEPNHGEVARTNIERAGLANIVDVRVGAALDTLPKLATEGLEPFDLTFIDADKMNNAAYFGWALELSRRGSLIIVDNVVRDGAVLDAESNDPSIVGTRRLYDAIADEPRVSATVVQTVGTKGYDGFAIALVTA